MKALRLSEFFLLLFFLPIFLYAQQDILISEIMVNPDGGDSDHEWIEAVNQGPPLFVSTDKQGWRLNDGSNHYLKGGSFSWDTGEAILFVQNIEVIKSDYPSLSARVIESAFSLKNSGGTVSLLDEEKRVLGLASYGDGSAQGTFFDCTNGSCIARLGKGSPGVFSYTYRISAPAPSQNEKALSSSASSSMSAPSLIGDPSSQATDTTPTIQESEKSHLSEESAKNDSLDTPTAHTNSPVILINEFLPNLKGADDDEFIELKVEATDEISLDKVVIQVGSKKIKLSGLYQGPFIVLEKENYGFSIRNKGETLILSRDGKELHRISYTGPAPEGAAFAKFNDGWAWVRPTAGAENKRVAVAQKTSNASSNSAVLSDRILQAQTYSFSNSKDIQQDQKPLLPRIIWAGVFLAVLLAGLIVFFLK